MSYDVVIGGEWFNYTYNVGRLFGDHIEGGLQALDGLTGKQAVRVLSDAFDAIDLSVLSHWSHGDVGEPKFCKIYDAPNGWGSAVGGLVFLSRIMAACAKHPRHKVRVA